jgi:hypothetical protein
MVSEKNMSEYFRNESNIMPNINQGSNRTFVGSENMVPDNYKLSPFNHPGALPGESMKSLNNPVFSGRVDSVTHLQDPGQ